MYGKYIHVWTVLQEIGVGTEGDKKTAKKQAAQKAIEFLLNYTPPAAPPELEPEAAVAQSSSPGMLHLHSLACFLASLCMLSQSTKAVRALNSIGAF